MYSRKKTEQNTALVSPVSGGKTHEKKDKSPSVGCFFQPRKGYEPISTEPKGCCVIS